MKTILLTFGILSMLTACNKENKKDGNENENHCPVIAAGTVPQVVKDSFAVRYPSTTVTTWFIKDSVGYCAFFIQPVNLKKLAEFGTSGVFVMEEIDGDHNGDFEDSTGIPGSKASSVCECEVRE